MSAESAPDTVTALRCDNCRHLTLVGADFCPQCIDGTMHTEPHDARGSVYAATVVRHGPKGTQLPYGLAYVDLDDCDLRVMARYPTDGEVLTIGASVQIVETRNPSASPLFSLVSLPQVEGSDR